MRKSNRIGVYIARILICTRIQSVTEASSTRTLSSMISNFNTRDKNLINILLIIMSYAARLD